MTKVLTEEEINALMSGTIGDLAIMAEQPEGEDLSNLDYEDLFYTEKINNLLKEAFSASGNWRQQTFVEIDYKQENKIGSIGQFNFKKNLKLVRNKLETALEVVKLLEEKHELQDL